MLASLIATTLLLCVALVARRIWFHPLSSIPGPWIARFSDLLDYYAIYKGARTFRQHDLLLRYGSPVRAGTDHLIFSDIQSWTDIYGPSSTPCLKDPKVYSGFSVLGNANVLSATDRAVHGRLRRLLAHSFSLRGLSDLESIVATKVQQFVDCTMVGNHGKPVEILSKTYELYLDIVSRLSFGQSFDCLSGANPTARGDVAVYFSVVPLVAFLPFMRHVPLRGVQDGLAGLNRLIDFSAKHVDAYLERADSKSDGQAERSLLQNLAEAVDPETGSKLTRDDLVEHSILFLAAGSGTTAATLTFLLWECGRNEVCRNRLAEEIRSAFPDPGVMPTYAVASGLIYLKCVVAETLRLWGPLNASGPRVSPGKMVSGRWVPKGTIVETCAYTTARDAKIFPNPLNFDPSRWEAPTPEMKKMSRPFSYGPRNCIGQHLAEMALALTVSRLYQLYDVVPTPDMTPAYMQQEDKGVLEPKHPKFYVTPFAVK
ncbi:hypothetical protein CLAIMM_06190 [Cladophialophora immunda]|nr:hypothetical protein CLAIMM_06190 [Cladophialophora immunda]